MSPMLRGRLRGLVLAADKQGIFSLMNILVQ